MKMCPACGTTEENALRKTGLMFYSPTRLCPDCSRQLATMRQALEGAFIEAKRHQRKLFVTYSFQRNP